MIDYLMPRPKVISANREEAINESVAKGKQRAEDIARRKKREEEFLFGRPKPMVDGHQSPKVKSNY